MQFIKELLIVIEFTLFTKQIKKLLKQHYINVFNGRLVI